MSSTISLANELSGLTLGDARLERRATKIAERLRAKPSASFPDALETEADLEGFYRFLQNPKVTLEALLQPHAEATVCRMGSQEAVLVLHDTTECSLGGDRRDLGPLKRVGKGYVAHVSLAVPPDENGVPYGVLAVDAWTRRGTAKSRRIRAGKLSWTSARDLPNEQDKWFAGVLAAESAAVHRRQLVHIMDSEADDYRLLSDMLETDLRFVVRLFRDRKLEPAPGPAPQKLRELIATRAVAFERKAVISKRRMGPGGDRKRGTARSERIAKLAIRTSVASFARPHHAQHVPPTMKANLVAVSEVDCPDDVTPVEWFLFTTEPIETEEQVLSVVDTYRARWRIEEFFKALKTGCSLEKRQVESPQAILNALALLIPVAWNLLRLRALSRTSETLAETVMTQEQIKVLRSTSKRKLPAKLTARDAMLAVGRLGGHLKSNGDPGWQVLGRGYQDLLLMVAGYRLALAAQM